MLVNRVRIVSINKPFSLLSVLWDVLLFVMFENQKHIANHSNTLNCVLYNTGLILLYISYFLTHVTHIQWWHV